MQSLDNALDNFVSKIKASSEPTYSTLSLSKAVAEKEDMGKLNQLIERKQFIENQMKNLQADVRESRLYVQQQQQELEKSKYAEPEYKSPLSFSKMPEDEKELLVELLAKYEPEKLAAYNRFGGLKGSNIKFIRDDDDLAAKMSIYTANPEETAETLAFMSATNEKNVVKLSVEEAQQEELASENFLLKKRLATYKCYKREAKGEQEKLALKIKEAREQREEYLKAAEDIKVALATVDKLLVGIEE